MSERVFNWNTFYIDRNMEDFVTWVDTSAIKKHIMEYNELVRYIFFFFNVEILELTHNLFLFSERWFFYGLIFDMNPLVLPMNTMLLPEWTYWLQSQINCSLAGRVRWNICRIFLFHLFIYLFFKLLAINKSKRTWTSRSHLCRDKKVLKKTATMRVQRETFQIKRSILNR